MAKKPPMLAEIHSYDCTCKRCTGPSTDSRQLLRPERRMPQGTGILIATLVGCIGAVIAAAFIAQH